MDPAAWAQLLSAGAGLVVATSGGVLAWRADLARRAALRDAAMSNRRAEISEAAQTAVEHLDRAVHASRSEAAELRDENRQLRMDLSRYRVETERALQDLREAVDQCHLEKLQLLAQLGAR